MLYDSKNFNLNKFKKQILRFYNHNLFDFCYILNINVRYNDKKSIS